VLPMIALVSWTKITPGTLIVIFFATMLGAFAYLLTMKSLKHLPISEIEPLFSLAPAVTALASYLVLGESLTRLQTLGTVLTVLGVYVLESHAHERAWDPLRALFRSKYIRYVLLVLLIHTATSMIDRTSVTRYGYEPVLYIIIVHVFLAAQFSVLSALFGKGASTIKRGFTGTGWLMIPISLLTMTSRMLYVFSVRGASLALVLSVRRTSTLFSTIIGGELFHEKNLRRKTIAATIIVIGAITIILG
jgi:drug/metabolite transporter (DMT)-like permease